MHLILAAPLTQNISKIPQQSRRPDQNSLKPRKTISTHKPPKPIPFMNKIPRIRRKAEHSTESQGRRNSTDGDQLRHVELLGELRLALGADPIGVHLLPPHQAPEPAPTSPPAAAAAPRLQCHQDRWLGRTKNRPFSPDSIRGRIRASGWFRGLRCDWTERRTERRKRRARGVDGHGKSSDGDRSCSLSLSWLAVPSSVRSSGIVSVGNLLLALRTAQTGRILYSGTRGGIHSC